jgi:hypothetical protein
MGTDFPCFLTQITQLFKIKGKAKMQIYETPKKFVHLPKQINKIHDRALNAVLYPNLVRQQFSRFPEMDGLHYNLPICPNYILSKELLFDSIPEYIYDNQKEIEECVEDEVTDPRFFRWFLAGQKSDVYGIDMNGDVYYQRGMVLGRQRVLDPNWTKKLTRLRQGRETNTFRLCKQDYNRDKLLISLFLGYEYFYNHLDLTKFEYPKITMSINHDFQDLPRLAQLEIKIQETSRNILDLI